MTGPPPRPKRAGACRGWRKWQIDERTLTLKALVHPYNWTPGWNIDHNYNPRRNHTGGFYAMTTVERLLVQDAPAIYKWLNGEHAYGSMLGAGRVRNGRYGFRSSMGKPETLILTGSMDTDLILLSIADKYGIPTVGSLGAAADMPTGLIDHHETTWPPER